MWEADTPLCLPIVPTDNEKLTELSLTGIEERIAGAAADLACLAMWQKGDASPGERAAWSRQSAELLLLLDHLHGLRQCRVYGHAQHSVYLWFCSSCQDPEAVMGTGGTAAHWSVMRCPCGVKTYRLLCPSNSNRVTSAERLRDYTRHDRCKHDGKIPAVQYWAIDENKTPQPVRACTGCWEGTNGPGLWGLVGPLVPVQVQPMRVSELFHGRR